jgi:catechol 2,3-dioxygenase-like lactoylglutathione lyase family enzyme
MIINIRHTAIVVSNLKNSKSFYKGLGFSEYKEKKEVGTYIDKVTGIDNVTLKWAMLKSPDGSVLELLQYFSHPDVASSNSKNPPNRLGYSHIALTVDSSDSMCDRIITLGGKVINPPHASNDGKVKVAYCYDNEGFLIELVEEL